jgi:ribosome maturation protein SDO1
MAQTIAKIRKGSKHFEILVDMDKALEVKKGILNVGEALEIEKIFLDSKKGFVAGGDDLNEAFGTDDVSKIAEEIIRYGDVLIDQNHRDAEQEKKVKQVVDFLVKNAIDAQSGNPITGSRIESALDEANVVIKNVSIEQQMPEILAKLSVILPIKLETKRVKLIIPAIYTGKVYGVVQQYKESEKWNNDGSLETIVKVPAGLIMDFYDKVNSMTSGSILSEEIRE